MNPQAGALPEAALSGDVAVFSAYLASTGRDYLVVGEGGDSEARVRFIGPLLGKDVVWDCRFLTLRKAWRALGEKRAARRQPLRSCIEIGPPGSTGVPLRVALDLPCIDEPAIMKMIVMIRNYKRLHPGRHEFGASFNGP